MKISHEDDERRFQTMSKPSKAQTFEDEFGEIDYTMGENINGYKLSVMKIVRKQIQINITDMESDESPIKCETIEIYDDEDGDQFTSETARVNIFTPTMPAENDLENDYDIGIHRKTLDSHRMKLMQKLASNGVLNPIKRNEV